jgi:tetratricopeptide (TPR) repeat protein
MEIQKLFSEKAYALLLNGFHKEAIEQFRLAINVDPNSPGTFIYQSEIAKVYYYLGESEKAAAELKKLEQMNLENPLRKAE